MPVTYESLLPIREADGSHPRVTRQLTVIWVQATCNA